MNLTTHNPDDLEIDAKNGFPYAQYHLGLSIWMDVNPDYEKATSWFKKALKVGFPLPSYLMGLAYFNGQGVEIDYKKSFDCFVIAADKLKHVDAFLRLGKAYENGFGVMQDYDKALFWYEKAVAKDNIPAYISMGLLYQNINFPGFDIKKSFNMFLAVLEKNKGEIGDKIRVAFKYMKGEGVKKDFQKARYWFEQAEKEDPVESKKYFFEFAGYDDGNMFTYQDFMLGKSMSSIIKALIVDQQIPNS